MRDLRPATAGDGRERPASAGNGRQRPATAAAAGDGAPAAKPKVQLVEEHAPTKAEIARDLKREASLLEIERDRELRERERHAPTSTAVEGLRELLGGRDQDWTDAVPSCSRCQPFLAGAAPWTCCPDGVPLWVCR